MSVSKPTSFNPALSDVDLVVVPFCDTLVAHTRHLEQAIFLNTQLSNNADKDLVEVFVMTPSIVYMYVTYLAVIAGTNDISNEDRVFGNFEFNISDVNTTPTNATRRKFYIEKAILFSREYAELMPIANTEQARKVAKNLLRGLKYIICAHSSPADLNAVEKKLFSVDVFEELTAILDTTVKTKLSIHDIFQKALDGETIDDWPLWMTAQDSFARWLTKIELDKDKNVSSRRLYGGLSQARELLIVGLKDIIGETSENKRLESIGKYTDAAAGVVARLALANVTTLVDLERQDVPVIVKESYGIMVHYLQTGQRNLRSLSASVILLEYAFEQGVLKANDNPN